MKHRQIITKLLSAVLVLGLLVSMAACGTQNQPAETIPEETTTSAQVETENTETTETAAVKESSIDYLALVNKTHALPDGWEEALETVHCTNSVGDDVEAEAKAYDAYLQLKEDLETEGIYVDLDSARRSVADQQRIMDDFTKEYGKNYAQKTVAAPGYSEHHTGLALDLYLIVDGEDIVENEDMIQYTDIWEKIHEKLPEYGFILRYLQDKEHITGYGYEPWHIRYINNPETAKSITDAGITFESWLGEAVESDPVIDLGQSALFTQEELQEAALQVKCKFATFEMCQLQSLRYAGDENNTEENLKWLSDLSDGCTYTQCAEFLTDFMSPTETEEASAWEPDTQYKDYQWWLAREEGGDWDIVSFGY